MSRWDAARVSLALGAACSCPWLSGCAGASRPGRVSSEERPPPAPAVASALPASSAARPAAPPAAAPEPSAHDAAAPPPALGVTLHGVAWAGDGIAVAVGVHGAVFRSVDHAVTWTQVESREQAELSALWSDGAGVLVAVGSRGTVLRSPDGGLHWRRVESGTTNGLNGVWGRDTSGIYAVGDDATLLASSDGGRHWRALPSGLPHSTLQDTALGYSLNAVTGQPGERVVAVGDDGFIVESFDGSAPFRARWTTVHRMLSAVTSDRHGGGFVAAGVDGMVFTSSGEGAWRLRRGPGLVEINGLWADDRGAIFAVGSGGALLRSDDGGGAWTALASGTSASLDAVAGRGDDVVAVGMEGAVVHSTDRGATWNPGRPREPQE